MKEVIAYCGIKCHECDAYKATVNNDMEEKLRIASEWSSDNYPLKPEDVQCYGCPTIGQKIISFCGDCDIRECGINLEVENCGVCDKYPCVKLDKVFEKSPGSKKVLDDIRNNY